MNSKLEKLTQAGKAGGKKAAEAANKVYRVATSPEAKRVYAQAAEVIRKVRKK